MTPLDRIFLRAVRSFLLNRNPENRLVVIPLVDQTLIGRATSLAIKTSRAEH
jgi:hypothetical protein